MQQLHKTAKCAVICFFSFYSLSLVCTHIQPMQNNTACLIRWRLSVLTNQGIDNNQEEVTFRTPGVLNPRSMENNWGVPIKSYGGCLKTLWGLSQNFVRKTMCVGKYWILLILRVAPQGTTYIESVAPFYANMRIWHTEFLKSFFGCQSFGLTLGANLSVRTKTCQSECFHFWCKYLNFKRMKFYGTFVKSNKKGKKNSNLSKFKFIILISVEIPSISFVNMFPFGRSLSDNDSFYISLSLSYFISHRFIFTWIRDFSKFTDWI